MVLNSEEIIIKNLDHLGIVAGLIDEIGIVEIINKKLGIDCREKITWLTSDQSFTLKQYGYGISSFIFVQ